MSKIKLVVSFVVVLAASLLGFAQADRVSVGHKLNPAGPRTVKFVAAEGAATDPATGLPTRVVHKESGIVLVLMPAGEFQMGSPADETGRAGDERQHRRIISKPFYLGETEVTVEQFRRFVRAARYQ